MEGSYRHQHGHAETVSQTSEEPSVAAASSAPVRIPRANEQRTGGVQTASSFHSVSSLDSSAEMARYFPDDPTPNSSQSNQQHVEQTKQVQSTVVSNTGPYATVPTAVQPAPQQQAIQARPAPQAPAGIPAYSSVIDGVTVAQTLVNDVIVDLQTKVINETQQQYYQDFTTGIPFESLSPIYIRAPNPSIILRSDLHRLRAELKTRPQVHHAGSINQFQVPSFPPPH